MSSTDDDIDEELDELTDEAALGAGEEDADDATFPGDKGNLEMPTRRALVQLLSGPFIDGSRQGKLWETVLRDEAVLRQQLHNLFLDLVLDHEQKVAFTRKVVADDLELPTLLRKSPLTFLESALVLYLRQRLTQSEAQGERAALAHTELVEHLGIYERDKNVDHARFERQVDNAIEKAKKLNLLRKLRGSEDRYEVSPTLKLLFTAEDIAALTQAYKGLGAKPAVVEGTGAEEPTDATESEDSATAASDQQPQPVQEGGQ